MEGVTMTIREKLSLIAEIKKLNDERIRKYLQEQRKE